MSPHVYDVSLTFLLDEEVSPELFAPKILAACARAGAIRDGEGVSIPEGLWLYEGDVDFEDLGARTIHPRITRVR